MAGKGDKPRPGTYSQEYRDNFDRIFGKKNDSFCRSDSNKPLKTTTGSC